MNLLQVQKLFLRGRDALGIIDLRERFIILNYPKNQITQSSESHLNCLQELFTNSKIHCRRLQDLI